MKKWVEGLGYYLSCMIFFNFLYMISVANRVWPLWNELSRCSPYAIILLILSGLFGILGIISTVLIINRDDSLEGTAIAGKRVEITEVEDATGENYFANFSLIVLTGIALPVENNIWCVLIFLLVEAAMAIIYVKKTMIFMNPLLNLMDYSIYFCLNKKENKRMIFVVKGDTLLDGMTLRYSNTNAEVIRLGTRKKKYRVSE